jgi:uncharacterized protein YcsI (UPF0317 family)
MVKTMNKLEKYKSFLHYAEKNLDVITDLISECYKKAFNSRNLGSGLKTSVEIDENSSWITRVMSQNSQSASSFNNDSYVFYSIDCNFDVEENCTDEEMLDYLLMETDTIDIYNSEIDLLKQYISGLELDYR